MAFVCIQLWSQTSASNFDLNGNQISDIIKNQPYYPQLTDDAGNEWFSAGPFGGDVFDIAFAPGNSDISFAAAGIPYYRNGTSDSWHILENLYSLSPGGIHVFEASENGNIYASGESNFYKIFKSEDDGVSWTNVNVPISGSCLDIQIDPSDPDVIYVTSSSNLGATQNKVIAKSSDGGLTWTAFDMTAVLPIGWACVCIAVDPDDSQNIFAIGNESFSNAAVVASFDGGSSWQNVTNNLPVGKPYNYVAISNGNVFVCGGQLFGSNYMGIYKSDNMGSSWTNISTSFPKKVVNTLLINPDDAMKMYAGTEGDGVYYTVNGGITWNYNTGGDADKGSVRALSFITGNYSVIHAGFLSLGVAISNDAGANWESSTIGIASLATNDIETSGTFNGDVLVSFEAENSGGCYISNNGEWTLVDGLPATRYSAVDINFEGTMFAWSNGPTTIGDEGLYKSSDGGINWENLGPNIGGVFETQIWTVATSPTDANLIFIGGNNFGANGWASMIYKTIDGGANWINVFMGPQNDSFKYIHIDPNSNDQILYAAYSSQDTKGGFLKSTDGGNNWTPINTGLPVEAKWGGAIVCDPTDSNILYGGLGGYGGMNAKLFRSVDAGDSWVPTSLILSSYSKFTDILVNPMNPDVIYAATTLNGIYMASDSQNWLPANNGVPATNITGFSKLFEYDTDSLGFFASSFTNSAFHTALYNPTGVGIHSNPELRSYSVYPNPSSGKFYISSENTLSPISELSVLDVMGKVVYFSKMKNNSGMMVELELLKGIYIVKVKNLDGKVFGEKIIVR